MRTTSLQIVSISLAAAVSAACAGSDTPSADSLNNEATSSPSSTDTPGPATGGTGPSDPGMVTPPPTGGGPVATDPTGGGPTPPPVTSPTPGATEPPGNVPPGPNPDAEPQPEPDVMGGGGTPSVPPAGTGGTAVVEPEPEPMGGGTGNEVGIGGMPPVEPIVEPTVPVDPIYGPREGSFKMLAYSKTAAFRHTESINSGKQMLTAIAAEQGFEVTFTETNDEITPEGLSQYEIVFFLNSTGDIFNNTEQQTYEEWMTTQNGAFAGVHSATDTENGWAFYSEVTGQYYDLHESCCSVADIQWDPDALNHITVQGLPSPWPRSEEWYNFDRNAEWSTKAGFQILGRVTVANKTRPVSYIREWGNFRSFYTSLGHEGAAFEDANVKKHVAAGIMWAVRREALLVQ